MNQPCIGLTPLEKFKPDKAAEGNDVRVEIRYSEYRAIDGVQYPHVQQLKISLAGHDLDFVMKVKEVKHNEKFEDSIFGKPSA